MLTTSVEKEQWYGHVNLKRTPINYIIFVYENDVSIFNSNTRLLLFIYLFTLFLMVANKCYCGEDKKTRKPTYSFFEWCYPYSKGSWGFWNIHIIRRSTKLDERYGYRDEKLENTRENISKFDWILQGIDNDDFVFSFFMFLCQIFVMVLVIKHTNDHYTF